jgi:integrase
MGKLTDVAIRAWIKAGERFEGRTDGDGLVLTWRPEAHDAALAAALPLRRQVARDESGQLHRPAPRRSPPISQGTPRQDRPRPRRGRREAGAQVHRLARIEAARSVTTVGQLADEYFERMINGRWKHPNIVRSRIEKDIKPHLGKLALDAVEPRHIDAMLRAVVKRGAPTIANDVLRWVRRMFDYAIKRHLVRFNPAAAFDLADAGGKELARERALSRDELVTLFEAMRQAKGFSVQNELTVKLLLLLAVRKGELIAARWDEFELEADPPVWHLPGIRTKTGQPLDIPLPTMAVEWLQKLKELACNAAYVLPARKLQTRMVPHVCESTLGVAMGKVKHGLPHFTVHDFRRTARTHLAALGVEPHVAERCLNHKLVGADRKLSHF